MRPTGLFNCASSLTRACSVAPPSILCPEVLHLALIRAQVRRGGVPIPARLRAPALARLSGILAALAELADPRHRERSRLQLLFS